jgi:hypothetical protein
MATLKAFILATVKSMNHGSRFLNNEPLPVGIGKAEP